MGGVVIKNFITFITRCRTQAWIIWVVAAVFYAYEFFLRISPAVMVNQLLAAFNTTGALLGTLSACYYYAYASMQIPVGILLDRYGIRRLLTFAAIMVAGGSLLFANAHSLLVADLGRILMGVGSAFSFVGCLKLANNWFPAKQFAVIIGLTNMLGVFGAISAEAPLSIMVEHFGWRSTMLHVGVIGALMAFLIQLIVKDDPKALGCTAENPNEQTTAINFPFFSGLKRIIADKRMWVNSFYGCLMVAPLSAFSELWSVPFLITVDHLAKTQAAFVSSLVFIGVAVGAPLNGWISGVLKKRKLVMFLGNLLTLFSLSMVIFVPNIPEYLVGFLLFCFGYGTSVMLLVFAINNENHPSWTTGVVVGFTNMLVMLGGTFYQPLVGRLLDIDLGKISLSHHLAFSASNYHHALIILPITQIISLFMLFFIRETHCRRCVD